MKKNLITGLKMIIFAGLLVLMLLYFYYLFTIPAGRGGDETRERYNEYYALEKNTIDCMFIGSSGTDRYWIPSVAWKEKGITSYMLTSGDQHVLYVKYLMNEALRDHDVKVFVVDLRTFLRDLSEFKPRYIRRLTDSMHFSVNKVQMTHEILKEASAAGADVDPSDFSYYYCPIKFHGEWTELTADRLTNVFPKLGVMGYLDYEYAYVDRDRDIPAPNLTDARMPFPESNKKYIDDLLEYCNDHDFEVVFFSTPMSRGEDVQGMLNYAEDYVKEKGFRVVNFNSPEMYEAINWDYKNDLYNKNHCNFRGAVKVIHYMEDLLINEYGLEDHRDDPDAERYSDWENGFNKIMQLLKQYNEKYYEEYTATL